MLFTKNIDTTFCIRLNSGLRVFMTMPYIIPSWGKIAPSVSESPLFWDCTMIATNSLTSSGKACCISWTTVSQVKFRKSSNPFLISAETSPFFLFFMEFGFSIRCPGGSTTSLDSMSCDSCWTASEDSFLLRPLRPLRCLCNSTVGSCSVATSAK